MKELLIRLVRAAASWSISLVDAVALDKVMRLYHKQAAKARGFNTKMAGWFMQFSDEFPQVELQRWAVDVVRDIVMANIPQPFSLPDYFNAELKALLTKLVQ